MNQTFDETTCSVKEVVDMSSSAPTFMGQIGKSLSITQPERDEIRNNTMIKVFDEGVQVILRVPASQAFGKVSRNIGINVMGLEDEDRLNMCENISTTAAYFALTYGVPKIIIGEYRVGEWMFNPASTIYKMFSDGNGRSEIVQSGMLDRFMEST
jgi:hypothetical protein